MIHQLIIRDPAHTPIPHWPQVAFLRGRQSIEFKPGLNVVIGDNGSGKSTLITALATLLHCRQENWPRVTTESLLAFNRPNGLADGLLLEHDGAPARYMGTDHDVGLTPDAKFIRATSSVLDTRRLEIKALNRMSSGQATLVQLGRFMRAEPKKVRTSIKERDRLPSEMQVVYDVATESLTNVVKRRGALKEPVVLLDEPDISMDFAKQALVWKQIRQLAESYTQVIVASHSPFAVKAPGAHYIETAPGYLDRAREGLQSLLEMT